ncbi:MAG: xanthine dehydrogenase family protein molybdopterin-binding subunit [Alphaproteobacteria bacterium]
MNGGIGEAVSRRDGPAKVTGGALYAADTPLAGALHAVIVPATRPRARIIAIDLAHAAAAPGVVAIFTHRNTPAFGPVTVVLAEDSLPPLQDDRVAYEGQPVALVVAETLEQATEAARLVSVSYRDEPFRADFLAEIEHAEPVPAFFGLPLDTAWGDVAAAWAEAEARIEGTYLTADRHHNPIEPAATLAVWRDGQLDVFDATQGVSEEREALAQALQLEPARIRIRNEFIGGGFGAKGWGLPHQLLAAMAARELERPVKLVLTRAQSYTAHGYQPATRQTVRLSARADGTLTGLSHDVVAAGSSIGTYIEAAGWETHALYATPSFSTSHRRVRLDRGSPSAMRAPFSGVGLVPVEIAMDELADELGLDPLELRLRNYAENEPGSGRPFSAKALRACYEEGAARFGWAGRAAAPRSMRDGRELVGYGMATAVRGEFRFPASARATIDRSGVVLVETGAHDVGQGLSTILPQIAADALAVPVDAVRLAIADTALPSVSFTGGSSTTMGAGSAVQAAAAALREKLAAAGANGPEGYAGALAALGVERLAAEGAWAPEEDPSAPALFSFGAVFAEVRVDPEIPVPRVSRVVGVYDAGRIINPRTARSQMTGGIIWGIGQALLERSEMDPGLGRFLAKNLSGYLVPVNADVPEIDARFVESFDGHASPLGARGIGELGAIGIGAAIANAVFHATGIRVREVPIRPEHLLGA